MSETKPAFATAFKELAETARREAGPSPTADELCAYLDGELPTEARERLKNRLALDPEATQAVLDLARPSRLDETPEDSDVPMPTWESVHNRLEAEDDPELLSRASSPRQRIRSVVSPAYRWAAAALLLLCLASTLRILQLERRVSATRDPGSANELPRINVVHWELLPLAERLPRDAAPEPRLNAAAGDPHLLILHLGDRGIFPDYRLEILDVEGRRYWSASGLSPGPLGTFNLELPRDYLPTGRYELRLFGIDGGRVERLATYRLRWIRP